jgi:lysozyme family protein
MRKIWILIYLWATSLLAGDINTVQTQRWETAKIKPEKQHFVEATVAQIQRGKTKYLQVEAITGVPWFVVGSIHQMECSGSFRLGLYCGDPLTARTIHVPKGRPTWGKPPFDWVETAVDSCKLDKLDTKRWTLVGQALQNIEAYNGLGVQRYHPDMPTAYLWSYTNIYKGGKYIGDGVWSSTAISSQCGAVPFLKLLNAYK